MEGINEVSVDDRAKALPLIKADPAMLIRTNPSGEISVWSYSLSK